MYQKSADNPLGGRWWEEKQGILRGSHKKSLSAKQYCFQLPADFGGHVCLTLHTPGAFKERWDFQMRPARRWNTMSVSHVLGNLLKSGERSGLLLVLKALGCIKMRPTTKEPRHNAMCLPDTGLLVRILFIPGAYIICMYSVIEVLPTYLLPTQCHTWLFSIHLF